MAKCSHGLTSAECYVCASPRYGAPAAPVVSDTYHHGTPNGAPETSPSAEVICGCGDIYPANSYGAGFIDALGHCENCDSAAPVVGNKREQLLALLREWQSMPPEPEADRELARLTQALSYNRGERETVPVVSDIDSITRKLAHIVACADIWEGSGVSRARAITRTVEEIRQLLAAKGE